ncbi:MAG: glycoside hydrolase family 32 protein, partial [Maioricimonas sp. JB049]
VRSATGNDSQVLRWKSWNVRNLAGRQARVRIFDRHEGGWGHITVDHILLTDEPRSGFHRPDLLAYRRSADYYREPKRPQFHFTSELNWINDPNGLVFYDGEYHLFYQHHPFRNYWGHMSWGHAVSRDLVHWEHLPVAIYDDNDVMAFSGCAVVDWQNSSGFGTGDRPPMVAIYTGHTPGRQVQNLAFSNDRGRTWTKYEGNPVLDVNKADFRDPKVFWHEETSRWVMVVSLAVEKRLQFYGSRDLKTWEHLSDFGPAGAIEKPNWECPDLFQLPVENRPGESKWVLEVDMGSGAVAGGSGGEYFVGHFDGTSFTQEGPADAVNWVDYGRDFYAPVSWSDIPDEDGRRIWIGWMNNWQTAMLPTHPWRGAMSVPRSRSLRHEKGGYRLIQRPVRELQSLRGEETRITELNLNGRTACDVSGTRLEIIAEFEVGEADEFGLRVRTGDTEATVIGYNRIAGRLFVDRTASGETDFHDQFRGIHGGPLEPRDGRVHMHILIDESSVEVFGGDGETVITERIFPSPESDGVELYSLGGTTRLATLSAWPLKSIWHSQAPTGARNRLPGRRETAPLPQR